jgi:hypothetical protein
MYLLFLGIKITASELVGKIDRFRLHGCSKNDTIFLRVGIIFGIYFKPFGVGSTGRFCFGTKHFSLWYILSIIEGIAMKKMFKQIKYMKDNRPELFQQFIFGVTMAFLSAMQSIALLLYLCFFL